MCLYISAKNHPVVLKETNAADVKKTIKVAPRPILVYKVLVRCTNKTARAPFWNFRYIFGKLATSSIENPYRGYSNFWCINKGLHSFTKKTNCRATHFSPKFIFPAIIPAGAQFYVGNGNEIVSNKLIVYKNMTDLESVHGKVDYNNPVKSINL